LYIRCLNAYIYIYIYIYIKWVESVNNTHKNSEGCTSETVSDENDKERETERSFDDGTKCWSHTKSSKLLFCMLRLYLLLNLHNTCRSQPPKDIKLPQTLTNLNSMFQVLNMEMYQILCLQCSISENLKNARHNAVARHCTSPPIHTIYHSSVFPPCITMSSSLWARFSFGTIRYNLSLATQFHISSQTLISKLLFDLQRDVDQGPCGCRWQDVHNLFCL
jgi:hypothetical protein